HGVGIGVRHAVGVRIIEAERQDQRDREQDQHPRRAAMRGRDPEEEAVPEGENALRHAGVPGAGSRDRIGRVGDDFGLGFHLAHDLVGASRPNRPEGRNTSTRTSSEKMITSVQATAMNCPPSVSISPMMTPPTIAPTMLPIPPSTAAVKARNPAVKPMMK